MTAVAKNNSEAIPGESGITMDSLGNAYSGIVRFFHNSTRSQRCHNGQYVGMADDNADEHLETDAHVAMPRSSRIAAPASRGILRFTCAGGRLRATHDEPDDYKSPEGRATPPPPRT